METDINNSKRRRTMKKLFGKNILVAVCVMMMGIAFLYVAAAQAPTNPSGGQGTVKEERHPEIHAAIRALERARKHLEEADHDFAGHRVKAIAACDEAIAQLKLALESDRK